MGSNLGCRRRAHVVEQPSNLSRGAAPSAESGGARTDRAVPGGRDPVTPWAVASMLERTRRAQEAGMQAQLKLRGETPCVPKTRALAGVPANKYYVTDSVCRANLMKLNGFIHYLEKNYTKAEDSFHKALKIFESLQDQSVKLKVAKSSL